MYLAASLTGTLTWLRTTLQPFHCLRGDTVISLQSYLTYFKKHTLFSNLLLVHFLCIKLGVAFIWCPLWPRPFSDSRFLLPCYNSFHHLKVAGSHLIRNSKPPGFHCLCQILTNDILGTITCTVSRTKPPPPFYLLVEQGNMTTGWQKDIT